MRRAIFLALVVLCSVAGFADNLPTAEEIVERLVQIYYGISPLGSDVEYMLYTMKLADQFGISLDPPDTFTPPDTAWSVRSTVDPLTDETRWIFRNEATSGFGAYGDRPVLVLRWQAGRTEMYITWDSYISDDNRTVTWRIGDDEAESGRLSISTDNQATFFPQATVGSMIYRMTETDRFVARIAPYNESPITAIFDTRGLRMEIEGKPEIDEWLEPPPERIRVKPGEDTRN